jgi:hypothetical protein
MQGLFQSWEDCECRHGLKLTSILAGGAKGRRLAITPTGGVVGRNEATRAAKAKSRDFDLKSRLLHETGCGDRI